MRHFTNSETFDVNYLFEKHENNTKNNSHKEHFTKDKTFDVELLFEK